MKIYRYIFLLFIAMYLLTFLLYSINNTKIWSGDKNKYTYYSENNRILFYFHKPLLYIQYYIFDKPYVFGHHHDPDGNNSGYYYTE